MTPLYSFDEELKVLIVDDQEANRIIARHAVKSEFEIIHLAQNGLEALEKAQTGNYDFILMDIAMPKMDGITATALIRADQSLKKQPVIIGLTAYDNYTADCLQAGMDAVILKPYSIISLVQEIRKHLEKNLRAAYTHLANS